MIESNQTLIHFSNDVDCNTVHQYLYTQKKIDLKGRYQTFSTLHLIGSYTTKGFLQNVFWHKQIKPSNSM